MVLLATILLCLGILLPATPALAAPQAQLLDTPTVATSAQPADQAGVLLSGWVTGEDDVTRYYSPLTHRLYGGWLDQGGERLYIDADTGLPHEGWLNVDGSRYLMGDGTLAPEGVMLSDRWVDLGVSRYHLSASGAADTGWTEVDGEPYCFAADGRMRTGWVVGPDGHLRWMHTDTGTMATHEWVEVDGIFQVFDDDGSWVTMGEYAPSTDAANVAGMSRRQRAVVDACDQVPWPGPNLCAGWVSAVLDKAGAPVPSGNANDMARAWCTSSNLADLKPGMLIAVPSHSRTEAGAQYGHVGIYVGNGLVRDSSAEAVRTVQLGTWIAWYGVTEQPRWGWACGKDLSA